MLLIKHKRTIFVVNKHHYEFKESNSASEISKDF